MDTEYDFEECEIRVGSVVVALVDGTATLELDEPDYGFIVTGISLNSAVHCASDGVSIDLTVAAKSNATAKDMHDQIEAYLMGSDSAKEHFAETMDRELAYA